MANSAADYTVTDLQVSFLRLWMEFDKKAKIVEFGHLDPLASGISLQVLTASDALISDLTPAPPTSNAELARYLRPWAFVPHDKDPSFLWGTYDMRGIFPNGLRLRDGNYLRCRISDDLSDLTSLQITAFGF